MEVSLTTEGKRLKDVEKATASLDLAIKEKKKAYTKYNDYMNGEASTWDSAYVGSEDAQRRGEELLETYKNAVLREEKAREELWSAKYDTMPDEQLQVAVIEVEDEKEKDYIKKVQSNRVTEQRDKDRKAMSGVGDPESVLYDPDFQEKSTYHSTKLPEGELGESDTGYADIDYEFINNNPEISELIVGKERNYYQFSELERRVYNYWKRYDKENGTDTARKYRNLIQEILNDRDSALDYSKFEGNALIEILHGFLSGLSKYGNDVNNWYLQPEGYIPRTSTEMTAQRAYESLVDVGDFIKINDQSLGQLGFKWLEAAGYKLPGALFSALGGQSSIAAGALVRGVFSGMPANGDAYQEMINRGYTPEEAERYGNLIGFGTGAANSAEVLLQDFLKKGVEKLLPKRVTEPLNKLLIERDWLGISDAVQSTIKEYAQNSVGAAEMQTEEKMRTTTQGVVTAKALDKILNQLHAGMSEVSPDLRKALLESLKDPDVRQIVEQNGSFTPARLDKLIAELENAEEGDAGSGTYVGDILFGANGYSVNRQYLQPLVDAAIRQRGLYANDPTARAIYERYRYQR